MDGQRDKAASIWLCLDAAVSDVAWADDEALDHAISGVLKCLGVALGLQRTFVITFSDDKQTFSSTHEWCAEGIHSQMPYFINLPVNTFPWSAARLLAGKATVAHDIEVDYPVEAEAEKQICRDEGIQSILFMPLHCAGEVVAAIGGDAIGMSFHWYPDALAGFRLAAAVIARALDSRRAREHLREVSQLERQKLGRDLHDSLGQELAAITMYAQSLSKRSGAVHPELAERAERIRGLAGRALQTARVLGRGLEPVDAAREGLVTALDQLARDTAELFPVNCTADLVDTRALRDPEGVTQLYWIAREAVNNAIRHGDATEVAMCLRPSGRKQELLIEDNGSGLADGWEAQAGIGLRVMKFRAALVGGLLTIRQGERRGASVSCVYPVE